MKKSLKLGLMFLLIFAVLTGCGGGGGSSNNNTDNQKLINDLLDNVQTSFTSMDVDKLASLLIYPFDNNGNNQTEEELKELYTDEFKTLKSYDIFTLTNRVITISGNTATINTTETIRYTLTNGTILSGSSKCTFTCKEINCYTWKISAADYLDQNASIITENNKITTSTKSFLGIGK